MFLISWRIRSWSVSTNQSLQWFCCSSGYCNCYINTICNFYMSICWMDTWALNLISLSLSLPSTIHNMWIAGSLTEVNMLCINFFQRGCWLQSNVVSAFSYSKSVIKEELVVPFCLGAKSRWELEPFTLKKN